MSVKDGRGGKGVVEVPSHTTEESWSSINNSILSGEYI